MLNEQLRQFQQSGGVGSTDPEVSSLRDQLNQVIMERDNIKKQMASTDHYKSLLEGENVQQKATIAILQAQVAAGKESHDGDGGLLQAQLTSAEEAMKRAMEESTAKDATIIDLRTRMLELQQTQGQLENQVAEMRKEKVLMKNAQLREIATQKIKYQHAVEENKQLKRDNLELGNALERAQEKLQVFKENSMALKEQLDKATDQATLDAITDKMLKYITEQDDTRAQVQALQESGGGGASGDVVSKMSRYREERNKALVQVQAQQAEIAKLSAIIAQMASTQATQPMAAVFNRQTSDDQPSSLPSSHGDVFASELDQRSSTCTSDIPSAHQTPVRHSGKGKATNLSAPRNPTPSKTSPQNAKKLSTSGGTRQPIKQTSKSVIKQVVTANGEESVSCEPFSSQAEVKKGLRVVVSQANSNEYGTVRAANATIDGRRGFVGLELDLSSMYVYNVQKVLINVYFSTDGTSDGQVKGVHHFKWLV